MNCALMISHNNIKKLGQKCSILVVLCLLGGAPGASRGELPSEYQIKGAFLYKFATFVDWPKASFADSKEPVVIGILGRDPFGTMLDQIVLGKTVRGRKMEIKRLDKVEGMEPCHILFISSSKKRQLAKIFNQLEDASVLTVGEMEWFARDGGMLGLVIKDERVQFEINPGRAERSGLKISSDLLKLAKIVDPRGTP